MSSNRKLPLTTASFVKNVWNAEDLVHVPGTDWVISSSMTGPLRPDGCLYLINANDRISKVIYSERRTGGARASQVARIFSPHGVSLRPGTGNVHTLYVVDHGDPEPFPGIPNDTRQQAISIFEVDARGAEPSVSLRDRVFMPEKTCPNDLVPINGGGFLVTNMFDPTDSASLAKMRSGENTGHVLEWQEGGGWKVLPGSEMCGPNGVEVSADGKWVYVASWPTKSLVRISRGSPPTVRKRVATNHMTDNLTWSSDGAILATGQINVIENWAPSEYDKALSDVPFTVVKIHPETLETQELVRYEGTEFGNGTVAVEIKNELWVGSSRADKIACFAL